jgi:DNA-binding MarR family transcriptional regulator
LRPKSREFFEYLERPRAVRTLLCLLNAENKGLDELLGDIGGSKSTGMARLDELVQLGLVLKKASQTEKRKMFYCLGEKGKRIAEQIRKTIEFAGQ